VVFLKKETLLRFRMENTQHRVHRASREEIAPAFELVTEYYEAVGVEAREDRRAFEEQYFVEGTGVWLAVLADATVGCVALRKLSGRPNCGEIKRMYVRASERGNGIADALLEGLEKFAAQYGYEWLYLDTTDSMIAAAKFYQRNSYERCECYNKNPQATLFMRKRLTKKT
jgi:GNAT superfamily N-acetyltransferase